MKVQKLRGIITNYHFGILCEYNILISWPLTLCQSPLNSDILSSAIVFCEKEKGVIHEDLKNEYCHFCGQEAGPLLRTNAGSLSTSRSGAIIPAQNIEVVDLSNDTSIPIIPALTAPVQRFASFAANSKAVEATHQGSILKSKSMSNLKSAGAGMGKHKKIIAKHVQYV